MFRAKSEQFRVIEAQVHSSLHTFLQEQGQPGWPHSLTMARLVARALRLGRSALIQTGLETLHATSANASYRLSYLTPALIWERPVILVAPGSVQQRLLRVEIPRLQEWIGSNKRVYAGDNFPDDNFDGLLITSPASWLTDRLSGKGWFPRNIPTIIDGADELEEWARKQLQACIQPWDWNELMGELPNEADWIREIRVQLTKAVFEHPPNPYECCLIEAPEQALLRQMFEKLELAASLESTFSLPKSWKNFWQCWQRSGQLMWAEIARSPGQFSLYCSPVEVTTALSSVWSEQPVVLIGGSLDLERSAPVYRQQLGLGDLTCLKFSPDRQNELIQLYLPDRLPMPNTPPFQSALIQQVRTLLNLSSQAKGSVAILVGDVPLKAQLGAVMAAEFGSRVRVEKTSRDERGILIAGWEFWRRHQWELLGPQLLIVTTLPIPSLENPLVAGQVAYYKQRRLDWFRLYLLPAGLRELQRAVASVREAQGVVAILDNRVNHRSYGRQVLLALSPFARINYLDESLFTHFIS
ncbi:ATP-dependent DNA helicase [Lyngbya aestuarii]|uniref:ATP-dependent DNA helicase n=1 Tax=Lyngbya aestuarii TaxID=118322 RepID=UPI00403DA14E